MSMTFTQMTLRPHLQGLLLAIALSLPLPGQADDSLYQALGARDGIAGITERLLVRAMDDPTIGRFFDGVDMDALHGHLTEQICQLSGGPCTYEGRSLEESHKGMFLNSAHFNALVEHLVLAMEAKQVPTGAQNRLLAILAPLRPLVIER